MKLMLKILRPDRQPTRHRLVFEIHLEGMLCDIADTALPIVADAEHRSSCPARLDQKETPVKHGLGRVGSDCI